MPFQPLDGNFTSDPARGLPVVLNVTLEQLVRLRADVSALHAVLQLVAHHQGQQFPQLQQLREEVFQQTYDAVSAALLAELDRSLPPRPPAT